MLPLTALMRLRSPELLYIPRTEMEAATLRDEPLPEEAHEKQDRMQ